MASYHLPSLIAVIFFALLLLEATANPVREKRFAAADKLAGRQMYPGYGLGGGLAGGVHGGIGAGIGGSLGGALGAGGLGGVHGHVSGGIGAGIGGSLGGSLGMGVPYGR